MFSPTTGASHNDVLAVGENTQQRRARIGFNFILVLAMDQNPALPLLVFHAFDFHNPAIH